MADLRAGLDKQFDFQRDRARQAENANVQAKREALARRQAQLGGGPGGAFIKAEQNVLDESQNRLANVNQQIDAAKVGEERRIGEIENAQAFTRSEREAGQGFAAAQAELGRKFATGEREASQLFSRGEREASQGWQGDQAKAARDWQANQNEIARTLQDNQWIRQMDQAERQMDWQQQIDKFNMDMSEKMFNEKDFLEKALSKVPGFGGDQWWNKAGGVGDVVTGGMFNPAGIYGSIGSGLQMGGGRRKRGRFGI